MPKTSPSPRKLNIPNILTIFRFILVPFILYFYVRREFGLAFWLFCLAGLTDFFDGLIARKFESRTPFGAKLDPAADKFLMAASYITLAILGSLPWWLTLFILFNGRHDNFVRFRVYFSWDKNL